MSTKVPKEEPEKGADSEKATAASGTKPQPKKPLRRLVVGYPTPEFYQQRKKVEENSE